MRFYIKYKIPLIQVLLVVAILVGCSTEKNKFINRKYHNITAHYNGYFNGRESFKDGKETIEKNHIDDYSKVLPVYKYGDESQAQSVFPQMDKAIKKGSMVIQKHSMLIRDKEYNSWIDDCYMLIGKSNFYKRDYYLALDNFRYVAQQFKEDPARHEARLWLIRTYNQLERYDESRKLIDFIKNDPEFPKSLQAEYSAVKADYHIQQKNYESAIDPMTQAAALTKNNKLSTRYTFILAQLQQNSGNNEQAYQLYGKVLKSNPPYEMAFNAKINRAQSFSRDVKGASNIKKELRKMLRDDKNIEYRDQIYYALGNVNLKEQDTALALQNFDASVQSSVKNNHQKAASYLVQADIYFSRQRYELAHAYYDSTTQVMPKDDPQYEFVEDKKNSLTDLVKHLNTVTREDSLQRWGKMPKNELYALIDKLIEQKIEEMEKQKEQENQQQAISPFPQQNQPQAIVSQGGEWYFDNPTAISYGQSEFIQRWGNRKLEDNWRRKNKQSGGYDDPGSATATAGTTGSDSAYTAIVSRETYLQGIPSTEEEFAASDKKLIEALYNLGLIYKDGLRDNKKAVATFEDLLNRYPDNEHRLSVLYHLFLLHKANGKTAKADKYKDLILNEYPDSEYARIIKNPNFYKEAETENKKAERLYKKAYEAYLQGNYSAVGQLRSECDSLYPNSETKTKFAYLNALIIGKKQGKEAFEAALKDFIATYPSAKEKEAAQSILDHLTKEEKSVEATVNDPSAYYFNENSVNYYIMMVPNDGIDLAKLKTAISNFNAKYFGNEALQTTDMMYNETHSLITVKQFENSKKGLSYFKTIKANDQVFNGVPVEQIIQFLVSDENFKKLYQKKDWIEYLRFFEKEYLKKVAEQ